MPQPKVRFAGATMRFFRLSPHARYRVNGPTSNMTEFAKAFGCREGQKMVRKNICEIW